MRLKARLRSGVAAIAIATMIAPTGFAEGPPAAQHQTGGLAVSVAEDADVDPRMAQIAGDLDLGDRGHGAAQTAVLDFAQQELADLSLDRLGDPD